MLRTHEVDMTVNPQGINYANSSYEFFDVREVYIDGKSKGEYHIKPTRTKDLSYFLAYLRSEFVGNEVGQVDPTGTLDLEYPIYLKITEPMYMDIAFKLFSKIDEEIKNWINR
jgi:hypothetical protein